MIQSMVIMSFPAEDTRYRLLRYLYYVVEELRISKDEVSF